MAKETMCHACRVDQQEHSGGCGQDRSGPMGESRPGTQAVVGVPALFFGNGPTVGDTDPFADAF